jgi:hypothetical protein
MKKTTKTKMGPLGTPLGNPLGYFNSQKAKRSAEPKQNLRKAQNGGPMYSGPLNETESRATDSWNLSPYHASKATQAFLNPNIKNNQRFIEADRAIDDSEWIRRKGLLWTDANPGPNDPKYFKKGGSVKRKKK